MRRTYCYAAMTKDEVQRSPSVLPFGCELRAERLRAMSPSTLLGTVSLSNGLSNGRWTFYEAVTVNPGSRILHPDSAPSFSLMSTSKDLLSTFSAFVMGRESMNSIRSGSWSTDAFLVFRNDITSSKLSVASALVWI